MDQNCGNTPLVQVPIEVISVASKLSTIVERPKEQECLFHRGDYKKYSHKLEKISLVRDLVQMLGLLMTVFSYNTQRYVSNAQAYSKRSSNKN
jgi:hypothetical protein